MVNQDPAHLNKRQHEEKFAAQDKNEKPLSGFEELCQLEAEGGFLLCRRHVLPPIPTSGQSTVDRDPADLSKQENEENIPEQTKDEKPLSGFDELCRLEAEGGFVVGHRLVPPPVRKSNPSNGPSDIQGG